MKKTILTLAGAATAILATLLITGCQQGHEAHESAAGSACSGCAMHREAAADAPAGSPEPDHAK